MANSSSSAPPWWADPWHRELDAHAETLQALAAYVSGSAPPDESAALQHRLATDPTFAAFAAPTFLVWSQAPLRVPAAASDPVMAADSAVAWQAIHRRIAADRAASAVALPTAPLPERVFPKRSVPRLPLSRWRLAQATPSVVTGAWLAVVVLLLCLATIETVAAPRLAPVHQYVARTTARIVTLPDGSHVTLAPGATLATDPSFTRDTRTVYLQGHGEFAVHADPRHPFTVTAYDVDAIALGTEFHVNTDAEGSGRETRVTVGVTRGKVLLQRQGLHAHRETVGILGPQQSTTVHTFLRNFRAGWAAAAAHKTIAQLWEEDQAMHAADPR